MGTNNSSSKRDEHTALDPARTARNLHRRLYNSVIGWLLERAELEAARGFMHLSRALPDRWREGLADVLREAAFRMLSRQRQICYGNLTIARGEVWETERIRSFTKQIFGFWSRMFVDFARLRLQMTRSNWQRYLFVDSTRTLDRVLDRHGGAILVSPHLGNWEFATQVLVLKGYSITSVARRRTKSSLLDRDLKTWREKWGQRILYKDESPREILRRLQNGEVIGMVADQYAGRDGVFTDFFGAPTAHYAGPAVLADRAGVPIIPGCCYRDERHGTYHASMMEPIYPDDSLPRDDRTEQTTAELFHRIEQMIRSHPRQWLWFHRKWREKWLPDRYRELLRAAPYITAEE